MKQSKLVKELYKACVEHNDKKIAELRKKEFAKIFKRRAEGKSVCTPKWALIKV